MDYRIEKDTMGEVKVPAEALTTSKLHRILIKCRKKLLRHLLT